MENEKLAQPNKSDWFYASSKVCSSAQDLFYLVSAVGHWQRCSVFMNALFIFSPHHEKL